MPMLGIGSCLWFCNPYHIPSLIKCVEACIPCAETLKSEQLVERNACHP